jgi:hypothetical protein
VKYQPKFYTSQQHLLGNLEASGEEERKASLFCTFNVDSELPGCKLAGRIIHRVEHNHALQGEYNLVDDIFGIEGVESIWVQPYRLTVSRAELAGGGWQLIEPRVAAILQSHLDPSSEESPERLESPKSAESAFPMGIPASVLRDPFEAMFRQREEDTQAQRYVATLASFHRFLSTRQNEFQGLFDKLNEAVNAIEGGSKLRDLDPLNLNKDEIGLLFSSMSYVDATMQLVTLAELLGGDEEVEFDEDDGEPLDPRGF